MTHPALNSLLFLNMVRREICESIDSSSVDHKEKLKSVIMNEASDYEILHLMTIGQFPKERYDPIIENILWDSFKRGIVKSYDKLVEKIEPQYLDELIFEIGPVYQYGMSSSNPLIEHQTVHGMMSNEYLNEMDSYLSELHPDVKKTWEAGKKAVGTATDFYKKNYRDWKSNQDAMNKKYKQMKADQARRGAKSHEDVKLSIKKKESDQQRRQRAIDANVGTIKSQSTKEKVADFLKKNKTKLGVAGAVGLGAAGLYGAYKLYKKKKAEKEAAKKKAASAA